jgi:uncharacterized glyoxalase superfamily protein PhnB
MAIQLHTIGIIVNDMGKALAFYRHLGLPIPANLDGESNAECKISEGVTLGFLTEEAAQQADPKWQKLSGQTMNLQFECGSPAEVDSAYKKLTAAGYTSYAEPWDAFWGQRFARVKDPDSNIVNFFALLG